MKLEPTLIYGDNVSLCIFEPGEDTSEEAITSYLKEQGYSPWGVAEEEGIEAAIEACREEGIKEIVLAAPGWDPSSGRMPTEYTLYTKS